MSSDPPNPRRHVGRILEFLRRTFDVPDLAGVGRWRLYYFVCGVSVPLVLRLFGVL